MASPDNSILIRRASPEDAPDLARILIGTNRATFEGLVPDHCLDSPTREESIRNWKRALSPGRINRGKFTLVAENSAGHIIGYTVAGGQTGRSDYERELNVLMVDTAWQRQGVGRALISAVVKKLARESVHTLLVGVQVDNPNRAFYERMGAQFVGTRPLVWNGYATEEILYGWADTRSLIEEDFQYLDTPKNIRAAYDRWSEIYDTQENPTRDLDGVLLRILFPEVAGPTVVECGCGTGKNTVWLASRCRRLIALDFSEGMLGVARGKINDTHVQFYVHDIRRPWPLEEETADTVLFNLILEHIDDLGPVFTNTVQVMRPGARLLLSEYHPARLLAGDGARFSKGGSEDVEYVGSFTHTLSDYANVARQVGLRLLSSAEWGDDMLELESSYDDQVGPRILSMIFEKPLGSEGNFVG